MTDNNYSDFHSDEDNDFELAPGDQVLVRSLKHEDLDALVRIDKRATGLDRRRYYEQKIKEALDESGVRVSLVAEIDGFVAGFIMARVDYGEFGRTEPVAALDTINVDPRHRGSGVGQALLSQLKMNLSGLHVDTIRTNINWNDFDLLAFLGNCGFEPSQRLVFRRDVPPRGA